MTVGKACMETSDVWETQYQVKHLTGIYDYVPTDDKKEHFGKS